MKKKPHNLSTNISKSWFKNDFFVFLILQYIQGVTRNQVQMYSLEDKTTTDLSVSFINTFLKFIKAKKAVFSSFEFSNK